MAGKINSGPLGPDRGTVKHDVMIIDNKATRIIKIRAHEFTLGDVDDVEIYAAQPIYEWQQTDKGKFVMEKAVETPEWHKMVDVSVYSYKFVITAKLKEQDYTFYALKWGS